MFAFGHVIQCACRAICCIVRVKGPTLTEKTVTQNFRMEALGAERQSLKQMLNARVKTSTKDKKERLNVL